MYDFIDTTERLEGTPLPAEALKINGQWIEQVVPGYRTLHVSGRELFESEIMDAQIGNSSGSRYKRKRYPGRTITVTYQLLAESNKEFREAYARLNQFLDTEQAELIFNDEPDMYFIGTKAGVGDIEAGRNSVIGSFDFYCADPFKYSVEEFEESPKLDDGLTFAVNYAGGYRAYPVLEAVMGAENGFIGFSDQNGHILQFGDPDEVDVEGYEKSETLLVDNMVQGVNGWSLNNATVVKVGSEHKQTGTIVINSTDIQSALKAQDYGSGAQWHGPSWTKEIPADSRGHVGAKNCTFSWHHYYAVSAQDNLGVVQFLMTDKNKKNVAAVTYFKNAAGTTKGAVHLYVNGTMRQEVSLDCSPDNGITGKGAGKSSIAKFGSEFEFNISGQIYSFTFPEMEDVEVTEISTFIGKWGSGQSIAWNQVYSMKFVSHSVEAWRDVPNKFGAEDVLRIDCSSGEVMLNGVKTIGLGALGNDWENFYLTPGMNQIRCMYSEWTEKAPQFKLKYREACI